MHKAPRKPVEKCRESQQTINRVNMFIVQLHFGRGFALTFASLRLPLLLALILSIIYKLRTKLIKEKNRVRNYESNTKYN